MGEVPGISPAARPALRGADVQAVLVASVTEHDWSRPIASLQPGVAGRDLRLLVTRAEEHRVAPAVLTSLAGLEGLDEERMAHLRAVHRRGLARQMLASAELGLVRDTFSAKGLPWVVVKGAVVAHEVYSRPDLRTYADIDVLVERRDFARAVAVLEAVGARVLDQHWDLLCADVRGQVHLRLPGGTPLDLHWNLVNRSCDREALDVETAPLLEAVREVDVGGLTVPTLDVAATLAHLCLHAGLSGGDRLGWLKDVDRAVVRLAPDWERVVELAQHWRARLLIGLVLRRASTTLRTPVPPPVLRALIPRGAIPVAGALDLSWPVGRHGTGYSLLHLSTSSARDRGWTPSALTSRLVDGAGAVRVWQAVRGRSTPPPSPEFAIKSGRRDRYFSLVRDDGGTSAQIRAS